MKSSGEHATLSPGDAYVSPSSFTPINRPGAPHQSSSPPRAESRSSALPAQQRRHHPLLVDLLGLGADQVSPPLQRFAPASPASSRTLRKKRKGLHDVDPTRVATRPPRESKQPPISDSNAGFRVTKTVSIVPTGSSCTLAPSNTTATSSGTLVVSNANPGQLCSGNESQPTVADEFFDDVFDAIEPDSPLERLVHDTQGPSLAGSSDTLCMGDDALLDLGSPEPVLAHGPSGKFVSPVTRRTEAQMLENARVPSHANDRKPIARSVFPEPVRDRSPIIGLSPNRLLRTCFRVGEAISQAGTSSKQGREIIVELYARVTSSERDENRQHFVFADLFHGRPPYLKGQYEASIWKHVELFNYDSGRFLSGSKMCRCVGKMKRNEKDRTWVMTVFNIWEATWEDIGWVEGIVNA